MKRKDRCWIAVLLNIMWELLEESTKGLNETCWPFHNGTAMDAYVLYIIAYIWMSYGSRGFPFIMSGWKYRQLSVILMTMTFSLTYVYTIDALNDLAKTSKSVDSSQSVWHCQREHSPIAFQSYRELSMVSARAIGESVRICSLHLLTLSLKAFDTVDRF